MTGRLYLVPNLLGAVPPENVLPARTIAVARGLAHFVVENAKPARAFLKSLSPALPLQQIAVEEVGATPTPERCAELLAPARAGHDIGLLSDAGCPGVADPGALLVAAAHREGIVVVPLVGPSSVVLALMASGMNGQGFAFHGYLPVKAEARTEAIRRLEADSQRTGYAQLFIETPVSQCRAARCTRCDLPASDAPVRRRRSDARRRNRCTRVRFASGAAVDFTRWAKRPAMFVLQG